MWEVKPWKWLQKRPNFGIEGPMIRGLSAKSRNSLVGVGAIAVLVLGSPTDAEDTRAIEAQLKALQAQISALQKEVEKAKPAAASVKASAEKSNSGDLDLNVKWRGAPELSSADGKFKMKVRGRLQADYNAIDQDEPITGEPDVSAATIRRARLGVESVVWGEVKYIVLVDFATIPLRSGMPMSSTRASPKTSACVLAISRHSIEG